MHLVLDVWRNALGEWTALRFYTWAHHCLFLVLRSRSLQNSSMRWSFRLRREQLQLHIQVHGQDSQVQIRLWDRLIAVFWSQLQNCVGWLQGSWWYSLHHVLRHIAPMWVVTLYSCAQLSSQELHSPSFISHLYWISCFWISCHLICSFF